MLHGKDLVEFDLVNPCIIRQGLSILSIFPRGGHVNEGCNVLWFLAILPRGVPKGGNGTITNGYDGRSIEEVNVHIVTRVPHTHPKLAGLLPLIPKPTQT